VKRPGDAPAFARQDRAGRGQNRRHIAGAVDFFVIGPEGRIPAGMAPHPVDAAKPAGRRGTGGPDRPGRAKARVGRNDLSLRLEMAFCPLHDVMKG
tara:strand:- start:1048 stop:1335 length:288 start_codon:yes stop_codon:yes gene_type:complete